jgi:hypothetical protein
LEPQKAEALQRLLLGQSANSISKEIGVHRSTILRWAKNDPDFVEALQDAEQEEAKEGLDRLVPKALKTLEDSLTKGNVPTPKARIALDIIKAAAQVAKLDEGGTGSGLAKRLAELDSRNNGGSEQDDPAIPD